MRKNMRDRAGRDAGVHVVGAARQDDGDTGAEHEARRVGAGEKDQLFR